MLQLLIALLWLAAPLGATTLVRYDLEGLTRNAASVFVGTCKEVRAELIDGKPYTCFLFTVGEVVKGQAQSELEVRLPGGEQQGVRVHLAGMPRFAPGEEVVLFLTEADPEGRAWPVGLGQGKFRIERPAAAKARVFQQAGGAVLHGPAGNEALSGMPLEEFLARVRQLAGEGGADERR